MKKNLTAAGGFILRSRTPVFFALALAVLFLAATGCTTAQPKPVAETPHSESLILREGDVLKISFPGSPNLDTTQPIRRDGKITLQLVGEMTAAGLSPSDLEKQLSDAYASQLVVKAVTVTVESSSIPVFVDGAVLRPQKVVSDHPISALEAIMEAGGFDYAKADLKDVEVLRYEGDREHTYILNLKEVMAGKPGEQFYLKPYDIVHVPERFSWF
jgi:polysaccharide export outer membrane protein